MCGIVGTIGDTAGSQAPAESLDRMIGEIAHRGPDDRGSWADEAQRVLLGHTRLSIIDLSPNGHQPMVSHCERFVIVYNGEIYNHTALRAELEAGGHGVDWRGHSDTETLLACIAAWGLRPTLERSVGMFALAVWDRLERRLSLARDRLGEKPLYYGWMNGVFGFASELKALRRHDRFQNGIDRDALDLYFRFSYVPAPYSIHENIYKLEPGCILSATSDALSHCQTSAPFAPFAQRGVKIERYWSLEDAVRDGRSHPITEEREALEALESAVRDSIRGQSIADVPLGAFLSGGIDSSTIVALMQTQSSRPVRTYTIGFDDPSYNEAGFARKVAEHLGTDHSELMLTDDIARDVIPSLPRIYCEPFADSSQIPTYLVARMASDAVKVALSGDAGDELFGGYNRYVWARRMVRSFGWLPGSVNRAVGFCLQGIPNAVLDTAGTGIGVNRLGEKATKLAQRLHAVADADALYHTLVSEWPAQSLVSGSSALPTGLDAACWIGSVEPMEARMMLRDTLTYLPDDILHKVDRAAMAVSLETRVPFLDHRVVELAWRLPLGMKIRNGQGKWALRQVLDRYVPAGLVERPKTGFALPVGDWLRGPLREWAETLLEPRRVAAEGYLDAKQVGLRWAEHLKGAPDRTAALWSVLMFQSWLEAGG